MPPRLSSGQPKDMEHTTIEATKKKTIKTSQTLRKSEEKINQLQMELSKLQSETVSTKNELVEERCKHQKTIEAFEPQLSGAHPALSEVRAQISRLMENQNEITKRKEDERKALEDKLRIANDNCFLMDREIAQLKIQLRTSRIESIGKDIQANVNLPPQKQKEIDNKTFENELEIRMQCEICTDATKTQCCPDCQKGLCTECYNRIRSNGPYMDCPYCRSKSDGWPAILMPRL